MRRPRAASTSTVRIPNDVAAVSVTSGRRRGATPRRGRVGGVADGPQTAARPWRTPAPRSRWRRRRAIAARRAFRPGAPVGSNRRMRTVAFWAAGARFSTCTATLTAALSFETSGVVTNTPHSGNANAPGRVQPDVAVDARSRVPAAVAPFVADPNGQHVLAGAPEMGRQVVSKCGVPVWVMAQERAVQPDVTVHVDAVEDDLHLAAGRDGSRREVLAIPAGAAHEPPGVTSACAQFGVERTGARWQHGGAPQDPLAVRVRGAGRQVLDAEIMRQVERAP